MLPRTRRLCSVDASAPFPFSSSLPLEFGEMHEHPPLPSGGGNTASQPGHKFVASQVHGIPTRSSFVSSCSKSSMCLDVYRAHPGLRFLLSHLSLLTLLLGSHSVLLASFLSISLPSNAEIISRRKLPDILPGRAAM